MNLDVLAAVHGGADGKLCLRVLDRRRLGSAHEHVSLALEAVVLEERVLLVVQGDPPSGGEVGNVEHPIGEQLRVGFSVVRIILTRGDELVDALVLLVVARVRDDSAGVRDPHRHALVPDAPEPGVLAGPGVLVEGIYLHHPAVVLGRLNTGGIVEPAGGLGQRGSLWHLFGGLAVVVLEVLFAGEHGVPWGDAPSAVVEGSYDLSLPRMYISSDPAA